LKAVTGRGRLALQIVEKAGKVLGFLGVAAEAPTVIGTGEFSNGDAKAGGGQQGRKFSRRKPAGLLISPALQQVQHPLI
jgi:hypothetical protein